MTEDADNIEDLLELTKSGRTRAIISDEWFWCQALIDGGASDCHCAFLFYVFPYPSLMIKNYSVCKIRF